MLSEIAKRIRCMKLEKYLHAYEEIFSCMRKSKISILELGVCKGGSMRLWHEYFTSAEITGVDTSSAHGDLSDVQDRVKIFYGDKTDASFMGRVCDLRGPFDIIIDDAGHTGNQTRTAFGILFERLRGGGYYAVEDWGTGYWARWRDGSEFRRGHYSGMVGFVKDLVDEAGWDDVTLDTRSSMFEWLRISHGQAIIKKK